MLYPQQEAESSMLNVLPAVYITRTAYSFVAISDGRLGNLV